MMIVQQLYDGKYLYTFKSEISELSGPRPKQQKHLGRKPLGVNPAMTRTLATMIGTWYFVASFPTCILYQLKNIYANISLGGERRALHC